MNGQASESPAERLSGNTKPECCGFLSQIDDEARKTLALTVRERSSAVV
jgi:hypothetical protein